MPHFTPLFTNNATLTITESAYYHAAAELAVGLSTSIAAQKAARRRSPPH